MIFANPYFWIVLTSSLLGGFFALLSISLRSTRWVELRKAFAGDERRLAALERHLPSLRLMCGFLRSLTNLVLAVAMVFLFEADRKGWGMALWAILASGAVMGVLGVAIPNAFAAQGGEKLLAASFGLLIAMMYALWPVLAGLGAFEKPIRRLAGTPDQGVPDLTARQEILHAASEGQAEGAVQPEQVRMIHSVMRFGDIRAGEIMTPRTGIFALAADTPVREACRLVADSGHSRVPIYQDGLDNIVGVLYAKDLLQQGAAGVGAPEAAAAPGAAGRPADSILPIVRKPFFVPQTQPLDELLREFQLRKVHLAIVLDEYGGTAGLVSIEDVLEKIVGQIADEHEGPVPELIRRLDSRTAEVDGRTTIDALNEAMGLHIPPGEDYATAAGLVLAELGYIPSAGETIQVPGARLTVLAATPRQITRLRVEAVPPQDAAGTRPGRSVP